MTEPPAGTAWANHAGQAAYEAYVRHIRSDPTPAPTWAALPEEARRLWRYTAADILAAQR